MQSSETEYLVEEIRGRNDKGSEIAERKEEVVRGEQKAQGKGEGTGNEARVPKTFNAGDSQCNDSSIPIGISAPG